MFSPQSYKLLRESAGLVAHALKVVEPVQQYSTPDCSTSGLNVLMNIFLAEAQVGSNNRIVSLNVCKCFVQHDVLIGH